MAVGSHSVSASAPMKMNIPPQPWRLTLPLTLSRMSISARLCSPYTARISAKLHADVRFRAELLDQVVGHAVLEAWPPHDEGHLAGVTGKVQRGLAGRVARADQVDIHAVDGVGLAPRRTVEHALADQAIDALDGEVPPGYPGREDEAARPDRVGAVKRHLVAGRIDAGD